MQPIEIIVIVASVLIVVGVIVMSIINKKKGKTSCGCDCANCKKACASKRETENEKE